MKFALACLLLIAAVQTARGDDTPLYQDIRDNMNHAIEWVKDALPSMPTSHVSPPDMHVHVPEIPDIAPDVDFPSMDEMLSDMGDTVNGMVHGAKNMANKVGDIVNGAIDGAQDAL